MGVGRREEVVEMDIEVMVCTVCTLCVVVSGLGWRGRDLYIDAFGRFVTSKVVCTNI